MKSVEVKVTARSEMTKNELKRFRAHGNIPAILYCRHMKQNIPLSVELKEFTTLLNKYGKSSILIFKSDDAKINGTSALIKEIQKDPLSDTFLNVDLIEIRKDEKITVSVPIEFLGEPAGVKQGGVVDVQRRELRVECLPADIPSKISIDISNMNLNDVMHVSDIKIADGVRVIDDKSFALISVRIVKEKVEAAPAPAEGAEGVATADAASSEGDAKTAETKDAKAADTKTAPSKDAGKEKK